MVKTYNVFQDGADFYLTSEHDVLTIVTYPYKKVKDFDMSAAQSARVWFIKVYVPMHAIKIVWI